MVKMKTRSEIDLCLCRRMLRILDTKHANNDEFERKLETKVDSTKDKTDAVEGSGIHHEAIVLGEFNTDMAY